MIPAADTTSLQNILCGTELNRPEEIAGTLLGMSSGSTPYENCSSQIRKHEKRVSFADIQEKEARLVSGKEVIFLLLSAFINKRACFRLR